MNHQRRITELRRDKTVRLLRLANTRWSLTGPAASGPLVVFLFSFAHFSFAQLLFPPTVLFAAPFTASFFRSPPKYPSPEAQTQKNTPHLQESEPPDDNKVQQKSSQPDAEPSPLVRPRPNAHVVGLATLEADYPPFWRRLPPPLLRFWSLMADRRKIHRVRQLSVTGNKHLPASLGGAGSRSLINSQNRFSGNTLLHQCFARAALPPSAFSKIKLLRQGQSNESEWSDCEALLQLGADPLILNQAGLSAFDLAQTLEVLEKMPPALKESLEDRLQLKNLLDGFAEHAAQPPRSQPVGDAPQADTHARSSASPSSLSALSSSFTHSFSCPSILSGCSSGSALLDRSLKRSDYALAENLLQLGANPLERQPEGNSPFELMAATWEQLPKSLQFACDLSLVQLWLKEARTEPLRDSASRDNPSQTLSECLSVKLNHLEPFSQETLLHRSLREGRVDFVQQLLVLGASLLTPNASGQNALEATQALEAWKTLPAELKSALDQALLAQLLAKQNPPWSAQDIAQKLNQAVRASGETPLHRALASSQYDFAQALILQGADALQANAQGVSSLRQLLRTGQWQEAPNTLKELMKVRFKPQTSLGWPYSLLPVNEAVALVTEWFLDPQVQAGQRDRNLELLLAGQSALPPAVFRQVFDFFFTHLYLLDPPHFVELLAQLPSGTLEHHGTLLQKGTAVIKNLFATPSLHQRKLLMAYVEQYADSRSLTALVKLQLLPTRFTAEGITQQFPLTLLSLGLPAALRQALSDSQNGSLSRLQSIELRLSIDAILPLVTTLQDCKLLRDFLTLNPTGAETPDPRDVKRLKQLVRLEKLTALLKNTELPEQTEAVTRASDYLTRVTAHFIKLHFNWPFLEAWTKKRFEAFHQEDFQPGLATDRSDAALETTQLKTDLQAQETVWQSSPKPHLASAEEFDSSSASLELLSPTDYLAGGPTSFQSLLPGIQAFLQQQRTHAQLTPEQMGAILTQEHQLISFQRFFLHAVLQLAPLRGQYNHPDCDACWENGICASDNALTQPPCRLRKPIRIYPPSLKPAKRPLPHPSLPSDLSSTLPHEEGQEAQEITDDADADDAAARSATSEEQLTALR